MDKRKVGYWVATGLLVPPFLAGGVLDILAPPDVVERLNHLGYPGYFASILGVWKVLAVVALLAPRFPRLKEWAYAGLIFDTTGAAISHAATGDPAVNVIVPLVIAAVVMTSWWLRPPSRKLASQREVAPDLVLRRETAPAVA